MKEYTREEVAAHNSGDKSAWIIIDGLVYNITSFAAMHPGGEKILLGVAGKDATEEFYALHRHEVLQKYAPKLLVGKIAGESQKVSVQDGGSLSLVPYGESSYFQGFRSPYFNASHVAFRKALKVFVNAEIMPDAAMHDESGKPATIEVYKKMGAFGWLASRIGPGQHMKGLSLPAGIKPEEFDYFQ